MALKAAITVGRDREEVQRRWREAEHPDPVAQAEVTFTAAPGDRGTEIHLALQPLGAGAKVVEKVTGMAPLAVAKDDLRRFKALVETGVIPRSEAVPEGETVGRKLKSHPAQPLAPSEREKAAV